MARATTRFDALIVGGGVIGLSLAWELADQGARVCVVDRGPLGREASWAGAGMVPPGMAENGTRSASPLEQLAGLSARLHHQWHLRLREETGLDNGYRPTGAIYLAFTSDEQITLQREMERHGQLGITRRLLGGAALVDLEPALAGCADRVMEAWHLPGAAQIRSPRHLRALIAACESSGVVLLPRVEILRWQSAADRVIAAETDGAAIAANHFCLAAGCWSAGLAESLDLRLAVRPVRGQIVLGRGQPGILRRHVCVGRRYLVPRDDGRLLVGSTEEDAGFNQGTTDAAEAALIKFAAELVPRVSEVPIERRWAGLRPATPDGLPYLGRSPRLENLWVATGHFRAGLQLSTGTAIVLAALIRGQRPAVDVASFRPDRPLTDGGDDRRLGLRSTEADER